VLRCIATGRNFKFSFFIMQAVVSQIECTFQNWGDWGEDREEKESKKWNIGASEGWNGLVIVTNADLLIAKICYNTPFSEELCAHNLALWGDHPCPISGTECHYRPSYVAIDQ
jgi:hypothetical protein